MVQAAKAITAAAPQQLLTLTCLPGDALETRPLVRGFLKRIKHAYGLEYLAVLERHESGLLHAHVLLHGPQVTKTDLVAHADDSRMPHMHLTRYRDGSGGYLLKEMRHDPSRARHLADNGGRLVLAASQGFFRDVHTGEVFAGLTQAKAVERRRWCAAHGYATDSSEPVAASGSPASPVGGALTPSKG
ncbi:hypothetical protein [Cellulomonas sp. NTE-D12]|uniref:rolling circle replication-associated protein n=1 Tax=Cellulomonas sp. NTE-D12 TaxID=2962632 RepID=UPI003081248F